MKVVLFCGGLGLRLRDHPDALPKPLTTVGGEPILLHVMRYYIHYGHTDFILCLGHSAAVIQRWVEAAVAESLPGRVSVSFVDSGSGATIGDRLVAARLLIGGDGCFLANYADVLTDMDLGAHVDWALHAGRIAAFASVPAPQSFHVVASAACGSVQSIEPASRSGLRINGGYFVLRREIFDFIRPGEELVEQPFRRLIARDQVGARSHDGFWSCLDTWKDKQLLDDLCSAGEAPWRMLAQDGSHACSRWMLEPAPRSVLCLGAHCDDIELGCGGTLLRLRARHPTVRSALDRVSAPTRSARPRCAPARALSSAATKTYPSKATAMASSRTLARRSRSRDRAPQAGAPSRRGVHASPRRPPSRKKTTARSPSSPGTPYRDQLGSWSTKMSQIRRRPRPPLTSSCRSAPTTSHRKARAIVDSYPSQREKPWWGEETIHSLARLRGVEAGRGVVLCRGVPRAQGAAAAVTGPGLRGVWRGGRGAARAAGPARAGLQQRPARLRAMKRWPCHAESSRTRGVRLAAATASIAAYREPPLPAGLRTEGSQGPFTALPAPRELGVRPIGRALGHARDAS